MNHLISRQIGIPCVMMRGGTSRGPFFLASDLPATPAERDALLLSVMGAGNDLGIDGIGGGNPLTSKVAIVGPATLSGADVDYLFAQVRVQEGIVDTSPNCGNMLAAVVPFAIEAGLVPATDGVTVVRIHNVNTGKLIEARVQTPGARVTYEGGAWSRRRRSAPASAAPNWPSSATRPTTLGSRGSWSIVCWLASTADRSVRGWFPRTRRRWSVLCTWANKTPVPTAGVVGSPNLFRLRAACGEGSTRGTPRAPGGRHEQRKNGEEAQRSTPDRGSCQASSK
ncbi:PrpF domain-containing protein [Azospirillum tabaci]|uniref:PrpF domain-containing protein n=1 Tax=Azospirillum tabaci TaxID=2752310 RepID=UPI001FE5639C|nr:PrpF domain-containing protein [Azospirillum tabaci]